MLPCGEVGAPVVDLTWVASMPESEKKAVRLFEQLIYGTDYDVSLRVPWGHQRCSG